MRVTGNLMNRIQEGATTIVPVVGMGATILMFSDRHATTIVEVVNDSKGKPKKIVVQRDHAKRSDGGKMSDSQSYTYEPNPEGELSSFTLRKNGAWIQEKDSLRNGTHIRLDHRSEYYDYGF